MLTIGSIESTLNNISSSSLVSESLDIPVLPYCACAWTFGFLQKYSDTHYLSLYVIWLRLIACWLIYIYVERTDLDTFNKRNSCCHYQGCSLCLKVGWSHCFFSKSAGFWARIVCGYSESWSKTDVVNIIVGGVTSRIPTAFVAIW